MEVCLWDFVDWELLLGRNQVYSRRHEAILRGEAFMVWVPQALGYLKGFGAITLPALGSWYGSGVPPLTLIMATVVDRLRLNPNSTPRLAPKCKPCMLLKMGILPRTQAYEL